MPRKKSVDVERPTVIVGAHVTRQERESIRVAAALEGKALSRWLRDTALTAAESVLRERHVHVGEPEE